MLLLFRNREIRQKESILKGIYEDNLRIIGKGVYHQRKKTQFTLKNMLMFLVLMCTTYVVQGSFFHSSMTPERYAAESLASHKPRFSLAVETTSSENAVGQSTFKSVQNNGGIPDSLTSGRASLDDSSFTSARGQYAVASIVPLSLKTFIPDEKYFTENLTGSLDSKSIRDNGDIPEAPSPQKLHPIPERYVDGSIAPVKLQTFMPAGKCPGENIQASDFKGFLGCGDIPLSRMFGLGVKTIMIDPGHGGEDPGTIGKLGTKEKDITLDISKRLRARLRKNGNYNILMTRDVDMTVPLQQRVELSRLSKADLFISIHINYLPTKPINFIETYYFGPSSDAVTMKLAEKENAGSEYNLSDFKEMIEKIGNTLKLQESMELATSIQRELFVASRRHNSNIYNYGIKRAPFVVLLGVDVPSVLAEVSCMSNRAEEIELNTARHRENIARYLERGILDYLNKGDFNYDAKRREGN